MPKHLYILLCTALLYTSKAAANDYSYSANCAKAYNEFLSMHFEAGREALERELKANPGNLMAVYLADYEDCIVLLVNCDKEEYSRRADKMEERLDLLANGDNSSPWYRFCYAGVHLHRAIVNIRFGEQYRAALNFRKSFALLKENQRLYPDFEYNNVIAGLQESVVGSMPGSYKWLAAVFGMKGSVQKGTDKLAAFVKTHNRNQPLYAETVLYYIYARFYLLAEEEQAWQWLNSSAFSTDNNLLHAFVKSNIALDYRHADEAIELLKAATKNPDYKRYPIFDFQYGMALLTRADTSCVHYFEKYLKHNKSDVYIKDAWQKMAFVWHVNGNNEKATYSRASIATSGTTRIDADKQAARFEESGVWPNKDLLHARLLIEGGYYDEALKVLKTLDKMRLSYQADKAEYHFRMGRIYEEKATKPGNEQLNTSAIAEYRAAMEDGKDRHEQFAARAALHIGKIYEKRKMGKEAIAMYNECLNMPDHDFQNSIDQQAKSGINRIEHW